jgi:NADH-quinone oxidoreductase subunit J
MKIDFLGFAFIIIYVGAIAILFLFVIMMINIKNVENTSIRSLKFFILVCGCCGFFFNQCSFFFYNEDFLFWDFNIYKFFDSSSNIFLISNLFFLFYNFSFLIAGLVLLVAMVGAILLTMDFRFHKISQDVPRQNARVSYFMPCGLAAIKASFSTAPGGRPIQYLRMNTIAYPKKNMIRCVKKMIGYLKRYRIKFLRT